MLPSSPETSYIASCSSSPFKTRERMRSNAWHNAMMSLRNWSVTLCLSMPMQMPRPEGRTSPPSSNSPLASFFAASRVKTAAFVRISRKSRRISRRELASRLAVTASVPVRKLSKRNRTSRISLNVQAFLMSTLSTNCAAMLTSRSRNTLPTSGCAGDTAVSRAAIPAEIPDAPSRSCKRTAPTSAARLATNALENKPRASDRRAAALAPFPCQNAIAL
mmetsp:Transcript_94981/g.186381  ORF Transcript_94981/g.186381 Transcript_94981/m.186381 type:complete len:219 (+) Transcript_94981:790-1446(+)